MTTTIGRPEEDESDIIIAKLWLCYDCTIFECNGDASGMEDDRYAAVLRGLERLEKSDLLPMSANFDSETGEGIQDFSRSPCDCCGDHLHGPRTRFAVIR